MTNLSEQRKHLGALGSQERVKRPCPIAAPASTPFQPWTLTDTPPDFLSSYSMGRYRMFRPI
jgi:hypothetical protein